MRRTLSLGLLAVACSGATSGGGDQLFAPEWQNDGGKSIAAVYAKVKGAALPPGTAVAVGVAQDGLVGVGLDGRSPWSYRTELDARPAVAGGVVVGTGEGSVFALDAKSGNQLWKLPSKGRALRGAGDDGSVTVVSLGDPSGGGSRLLVVTRDGSVRVDAEPDVEIGVPAVQGGVIFVPWGNQYVSALEVPSKNELGRLLMREKVSHAVGIDGTLYFGERVLLRFDERISQAASGGAHAVSLPERELPGKPQWFDDGTQVTPARAGARARISLLARPSMQGDTLGIDSGRFVATYFRIAMGFDSKDAKLTSVDTFTSDVVGGAAAQGGFVLCDASGTVRFIDERGGDAGKLSLGKSIDACVVQAASHVVPDGKAPPPLATQIAEAIQVREAEMAVAQRFLLRELGAIEDPVVTKALIDIASNPRTPPFLMNDARTLLAARRTGAEHMLAALEQHYDFLSEVLRPPPVGPIADALAAMNEKRAAPLLAKHLNDPANTADDVERAARALAKLATAGEVEELKTFFALYRATADQKELVNAVLSSAEALLRIGGEDANRIVRRAAEDPLTNPEVKAGLSNLLPPPAKTGAG